MAGDYPVCTCNRTTSGGAGCAVHSPTYMGLPTQPFFVQPLPEPTYTTTACSSCSEKDATIAALDKKVDLLYEAAENFRTLWEDAEKKIARLERRVK